MTREAMGLDQVTENGIHYKSEGAAVGQDRGRYTL